MAAKNNIRSIRFSDELAELIDRQVGDTFTQKFENLITRCVWELPQKEEQLQRLEDQIRLKRRKLDDIENAIRELRQLEQDVKNIQKTLARTKKSAQAISETVEKDLMYL